jgi:hypothetical protein
MGKAIEITRSDRSARELRELAARIEDGDVVRRLLGMALLLDGWPRGEAASTVGMDRQTLCDWVASLQRWWCCRLGNRRALWAATGLERVANGRTEGIGDRWP